MAAVLPASSRVAGPSPDSRGGRLTCPGYVGLRGSAPLGDAGRPDIGAVESDLHAETGMKCDGVHGPECCSLPAILPSVVGARCGLDGVDDFSPKSEVQGARLFTTPCAE